MSYLEVPILARIPPFQWGRVAPMLFAGPSVGLRLATDNQIMDARRAELSSVLGSGLDVAVDAGRLSTITFDARYQIGVRAQEYKQSAGPISRRSQLGPFGIEAL